MRYYVRQDEPLESLRRPVTVKPILPRRQQRIAELEAQVQQQAPAPAAATQR